MQTTNSGLTIGAWKKQYGTQGTMENTSGHSTERRDTMKGSGTLLSCGNTEVATVPGMHASA